MTTRLMCISLYGNAKLTREAGLSRASDFPRRVGFESALGNREIDGELTDWPAQAAAGRHGRLRNILL